jgi:predicted nuclease of restriction endonuclease-like (RecB) superfamily
MDKSNHTLYVDKEYKELIKHLKAKIKAAQAQALTAVNKALIELYWDIGRSIIEKQDQEGWGKSVVEMLAKDLQSEFSGTLGFSVANLWRMRNFYLAYKDNEKLARLVREIGWGHNIVIFERCKDDLEREYYIQMVRKSSWTRDTVANAIKNQSYEKFLINQHNFAKTLAPTKQADAKLALKDEYTFSFLELEDDHLEKDLERGLINNIRKFLIEMGNYFAFVGSQYRLEVDDEEYFIDLLLYHRKLRCLIAIELKRGAFQPEYAGKMQFYLSALDDKVKLTDENPSIGIIICQEKSRTKVEYTLRDVSKPMGIATYHNSKALPKDMRDLLPSPEEIAAHLKAFDS